MNMVFDHAIWALAKKKGNDLVLQPLIANSCMSNYTFVAATDYVRQNKDDVKLDGKSVQVFKETEVEVQELSVATPFNWLVLVDQSWTLSLD